MSWKAYIKRTYLHLTLLLWQDRGYADRVMLIYDGLHYDAMALAGTIFAP